MTLHRFTAVGGAALAETEEETKATPSFDHIALTVPNLDEQVERLTGAFGMVVQGRSERFALVADPASGLKLELSRSDDSGVHCRHLDFRTDLPSKLLKGTKRRSEDASVRPLHR